MMSWNAHPNPRSEKSQVHSSRRNSITSKGVLVEYRNSRELSPGCLENSKYIISSDGIARRCSSIGLENIQNSISSAENIAKKCSSARGSTNPKNISPARNCSSGCLVRHAMMKSIIYKKLQDRAQQRHIDNKNNNNKIVIFDEMDESLDTIHLVAISRIENIVLLSYTEVDSQEYIVSMFSRPCLLTPKYCTDDIVINNNNKNNSSNKVIFSSYNYHHIAELFGESLTQYNLFGDANVMLTVNVGKTIFLLPKECKNSNLSRRRLTQEGNQDHPIFRSVLKCNQLEALNLRLHDLGFQCSYERCSKDEINVVMSRRSGECSIEFISVAQNEDLKDGDGKGSGDDSDDDTNDDDDGSGGSGSGVDELQKVSYNLSNPAYTLLKTTVGQCLDKGCPDDD